MKVPILMYHQVSDQRLPGFEKYTVAPVAFRRQMQWLAAAGYSTVTLDELVTARDGGRQLPARPVVVTFDDGFRDVFEQAVPVMARHGQTATVYLVSGLVGKSSRWLVEEKGFEAPIMSWEQARELGRTGFTCGAHSVTHPRLAQLEPDLARQEIEVSRAQLEDGLGVAIRHFAYPFGSYDDRVRQMVVGAGFSTATSVRIGISGTGDDMFALHRVPVLGTDGLADFVSRLFSSVGVRELFRRFRRRLAASSAPGAATA